MNRATRIFLILTLVMVGIPTVSAVAAPITVNEDTCSSKGAIFSGSTDDGSNYCVWVPSMPFTGDLVIFAHGYVDPRTTDGAIPWDQLAIGGVSLPEMVMGQLHAAFAVTSYPHNGLAVTEGVEAIKELALEAKTLDGVIINHTYVVGASEGGLVTALAIEQNPDMIYAGGVSTCGPVGDFKAQVNYWGDFRVAYDYYFQRTALGPVIPFTPIFVGFVDPYDAITAWGAFDPAHPGLAGPLQQLVFSAIGTNPVVTQQLITTGKAPVDPADLTKTVPATVLGILDYNVRATDQARAELSGDPNFFLTPNKGNPYGNAGRWIGTSKDAALNQWVAAGNDKFTADPAALAAIRAYQTTGRIKAPLVDLHTTGDPIVPFWHEPMYLLKAWLSGNGLKFFTIPVNRYGHCNFTAQEAMFAYILMVFRATGTIPILPLSIEPGSKAVLTQQEFNNMMDQYGPTLQQEIYTNFVPIVK